MSSPHRSLPWFRSLRIWTAALLAGWSLTIGSLLAWETHQIADQAFELAKVDAEASFERDVAFRRWAARHGGVYVPVGPDSPANPHLSHVPERDLTSPSGRALTLMNSAYISRQVHEWYEHPGETRAHITSLKPLRPENHPDEWETAALEAFERGEKEIVSQAVLDGKTHLRFMRPILTEANCLKCHATQGYREGDIQGGISVSVPLDKYAGVSSAARRFSTVAYCSIWVLGVAGISTGSWALNRRVLSQQAADQARLASERKFRAIFQQSFQLCGVLSPDGTVLEVNECALRFSGIRPADAVGKPFWQCVWWQHDAAAAARLREAIRAAALEGLPSRFETTHSDRHGQVRHIDFSLRPIKDEADKTVLLVPEGRDITERKQAEEERARLTGELQRSQRLESIGRLAGGVAHDFNNLLSPVMGYTEILLAHKAEDDPDRPALHEILQATLRARDLTQQLLACGRRQSLHTRPMDLNATITGFGKALRQSVRANVEIATCLEPSIGSIEGDYRQIEQILLNLAINAQDAMPEGGRLTIETGRMELAWDDPRSGQEWPAGPYVVMTVSDTGSGMDELTVQRMFEPFFTTKPKGKGTGLGLPTVYGIVKQHRGQIEVDSQPGRGSTFRIYFPQSTSPTSPSQA